MTYIIICIECGYKTKLTKATVYTIAYPFIQCPICKRYKFKIYLKQ